MTRERAKEVLLLYRPGTAPDAEMEEAIGLARTDAQLHDWFEQHRVFQEAIQARLRALPVPEHLRERIMVRRKVVALRPWWQSIPAMAAAAAAVILVAGVLSFSTWSKSPGDRYVDFRSRMVATVLREYRMDVESSDMRQVRDYMASKGAPENFEVTPGLGRLALAGGGFLRWRNNPVSMVCFRRADQQMVYLFVMKKGAVPDPPAGQPRVSQVNALQTAAWSRGDHAYLLAGPPEAGFAEKYLERQ